MVKLARLNRLLVDGLPFGVEESVIQVDCGLANEIVSEKKIVVVGLNNQRRGSRERDIEVKSLVELGVRLIVLIIFPIVEFGFTASDNQIRVTG